VADDGARPALGRAAQFRSVGPTMAEAHPNVVRRRGVRGVLSPSSAADRDARHERLGRLRALHLDVLEEFGRYGLIPGTVRGWRQNRETADG
jgi:hypothetical protein